MKLKVFAVAVLIASMSMAAWAQQPPPRPPMPRGPKPTVADVQKVVAIISADKAKVQTYCDAGKIDAQMEQAAKTKDNKALQDLGKKLFELEQKLGPEYVNLMDRLQQIDPNSNEGKQLAAALDPLDKQCAR
jgi:Skp family chaperone for outer membrane proteins